MTVYYVRKTGSDSNNGTSPATAWLTIGKAVGASGMASGDTVWIGAGVYRETVTLVLAPTAETKILGDVTGANTGDAGLVIWSNYTTDDTTTPSADNLTVGGKDYYTVEDIVFVCGYGSAVDASTATSQHWRFRRCAFLGSGMADNTPALYFINAFPDTYDLDVDSCIFVWGKAPAIELAGYTSASGSDYTVDVHIFNCLFIGGGIMLTSGGISNKRPWGVYVYNCTFYGDENGAIFQDAYWSAGTSTKCYIYNCFIDMGDRISDAAITAGSSTQMKEDYNWICAGTPRTNCPVGSNSIANDSYARLFDFWACWLWNLRPAFPLGPLNENCPALGFGNDATYTVSDDILSGPRPAGGASTSKGIGCAELANSGIREASTVRTGSLALKIAGPGYHDFLFLVKAESTTITVYGRYDSDYTGTKPQMSVLANPAVGVTAASTTMTGSANTWEQLSLNFTPTAAGMVAIRLLNNSTAAAGDAYFDDFAVS